MPTGMGDRPCGSPIEIIVVANQFGGRLGSARNTALLVSRSEIVAFLDDDAEATPDWLPRLLAVYATRPAAVAVGGALGPTMGRRARCGSRLISIGYSVVITARCPTGSRLCAI